MFYNNLAQWRAELRNCGCNIDGRFLSAKHNKKIGTLHEVTWMSISKYKQEDKS